MTSTGVGGGSGPKTGFVPAKAELETASDEAARARANEVRMRVFMTNLLKVESS
jgi:hypothetical protein